jgi:hypothetical protein
LAYTRNIAKAHELLESALETAHPGGVPEQFPITLVTRDISSSGVLFLSPKTLAPKRKWNWTLC